MNVNFLNGKVVLSYNGSKVKNSKVQLRSGFPNFKEGISIPYYLYLERFFFFFMVYLFHQTSDAILNCLEMSGDS